MASLSRRADERAYSVCLRADVTTGILQQCWAHEHIITNGAAQHAAARGV
jgi:hypothetical protein